MTGNPKNAMVYDAPYLRNEFDQIDFSYIFNIILSFSNCSQSFKKICTWELLGANILKAITKAVFNRLYGCYGNLSASKNDDNMLTNARVLV